MNATATIAPAPQHMDALRQANEVRLARAGLKRRVADGEVSAAEVVRASPWEARNMTVFELLMSQRRWGRTRSRSLLARTEVPETKQLGKLTERQRRAVVDVLRRTP